MNYLDLRGWQTFDSKTEILEALLQLDCVSFSLPLSLFFKKSDPPKRELSNYLKTSQLNCPLTPLS